MQSQQVKGKRRALVWLEENRAVSAMKQGMVMAIPFIMAGSCALVLSSLPVPGYQSFLDGLLGGLVKQLLTFVNEATLGSISLILLLTISFSYASACGSKFSALVPLVALCSYLTYAGGELSLSIFKSDWLFTALVISMASSALFLRLCREKQLRTFSLADGADDTFNRVVSAIPAAVIVIFLFALLRILAQQLLAERNVQNLFSGLFLEWFGRMGRNLGSSLLFILLIHLMWFFGIHGGNVMDGVAHSVFADQAGVLFSKSFLDAFVLFGGCGTLLCLTVAILLGTKRRTSRSLAKMAVFPVLFNVNELLVFGIPIVLNPVLLIPFVCTPLVLTLVSSGAVWLGLVPAAMHTVAWTTPVFLSGYAATGSIAGSLLQAVNLAIGVLIYLPFVKWSQRRQEEGFRRNVTALAQQVRDNEAHGSSPKLLDQGGRLGSVARTLTGDLRHALRTGRLRLFYQPQVGVNGQVTGVEALLRYEHETAGSLYPPLTVALAQEDGWLDALGNYIIEQACMAQKQLSEAVGAPVFVSANLSAPQLRDSRFVETVNDILRRHQVDPAQIGLEITEQMTLESTPSMTRRLDQLCGLGVRLIMDDFGVGHTSLLQLQDHKFDVVKLDGSLVRGMNDNPRSGEIISAIVSLSHSLGFSMIAEYVETPAQRDALRELGCTVYQGYLYSPAVPLEEAAAFIRLHSAAPASVSLPQ